ncbi:hypothetical protein O181_019323 [Austropuccinia psidii MF-1]|uniref:ERCC4 domain-containing protein n=1 Tax=Austropuccinia psidii MF-1 TaxID=1389203 RepID=A0A9Q3CAR7_9BASI|nr:hypothetical protein [Austropuccinia psidii MF-1]
MTHQEELSDSSEIEIVSKPSSNFLKDNDHSNHNGLSSPPASPNQQPTANSLIEINSTPVRIPSSNSPSDAEPNQSHLKRKLHDSISPKQTKELISSPNQSSPHSSSNYKRSRNSRQGLLSQPAPVKRLESNLHNPSQDLISLNSSSPRNSHCTSPPFEKPIQINNSSTEIRSFSQPKSVISLNLESDSEQSNYQIKNQLLSQANTKASSNYVGGSFTHDEDAPSLNNGSHSDFDDHLDSLPDIVQSAHLDLNNQSTVISKQKDSSLNSIRSKSHRTTSAPSNYSTTLLAQSNHHPKRTHSTPQKSSRIRDKGKGRLVERNLTPPSSLENLNQVQVLENLYCDLDDQIDIPLQSPCQLLSSDEELPPILAVDFKTQCNSQSSDESQLFSPGRSVEKNHSKPSSLPDPNGKAKRKLGLSKEEKALKAAEAKLAREAKKAAIAKEKEENRLKRQANKLTLNRKQTVAEVRMYIPKSLSKSKLHPLVKACEILEERIRTTEGCKMNLPGQFDDGLVEPKGLVRWIRTSNKEWDEGRELFIPLESGRTIETQEPTVVAVWGGQEVSEMVQAGSNELIKRVQSIQSYHQDDQIFVIIFGLEAIFKSERRSKERRLRDEIRKELLDRNLESHPAEISARQSVNQPSLNNHNESGERRREEILKELEKVKILCKCFIIRVEDRKEFGNWLWEMTMEIGVRPYKSRRQDLRSDLRLEIGGQKSVKNHEIYERILKICLMRGGGPSGNSMSWEEQVRGIVKKFGSLKKLYTAWESLIEREGIESAEKMLIGCLEESSGRNRAGESNRATKKIGKVNSKRIFDILYGTKDGETYIYNH